MVFLKYAFHLKADLLVSLNASVELAGHYGDLSRVTLAHKLLIRLYRAKIAFESASSGSSIASLVPALMHASRPTIGVSIPPFEPISSSLSMHNTRILLCEASFEWLAILAPSGLLFSKSECGNLDVSTLQNCLQVN